MDVRGNFETAARGYVKRFDKFDPTRGFKRTLDELGNQNSNEGMFILESVLVTADNTSSDGRRAKKVKCIEAKLPGLLNDRETRRLRDGKSPPPWYPERQEIWNHAMLHVPNFDIKAGQSPRCFALSPAPRLPPPRTLKSRAVVFCEKNQSTHDLPSVSSRN
jgi:hypothetical protein